MSTATILLFIGAWLILGLAILIDKAGTNRDKLNRYQVLVYVILRPLFIFDDNK